MEANTERMPGDAEAAGAAAAMAEIYGRRVTLGDTLEVEVDELPS
jgi:hypothetical protein